MTAHAQQSASVISWHNGDIFACDAEAVVNPVNCVGVMGRGLAAAFKSRYPLNFQHYAAACRRGDVAPGRLFVFPTQQMLPPLHIINFPTKRHWRDASRLDDIEAGLRALVPVIDDLGIRSVAIPALGAGLGGLAWNDVSALIIDTLSGLPDTKVLVFHPGGTAQGRNT